MHEKNSYIHISVYTHIYLHLLMSFRIIELLWRKLQPVFTARKPSFTKNFTKRQILENLVFSIFPTSEYIPQIPNFPCENSIRKWSVACVAGVERGRGLKNREFAFRYPALYWDGSAHALFPRQIVVDPLAEISFGISFGDVVSLSSHTNTTKIL